MDEISRLAAQLSKIMRGSVRRNEPFGRYTTLGIGGPVDLLIEPADLDDLKAALVVVNGGDRPVYVIGQGSNSLIPDRGLRAVIIRLNQFRRLEIDGRRLIVGCGYPIPKLLREAAARGLGGLEPLAGVPGTIGGALVMNAGTRKGNIGETVEWVKLVDRDGDERVLNRDQMAFGYRESRLQREPELIAVEAALRLKRAEPESIRKTMEEASEYRKKTQPLHIPNAGSTFKNPDGDAAGRLLDAAGCKGLRVGDAAVSELHANFVVNRGEATAEDVVTLMIEMWKSVYRTFGVRLEPELRLWGGLREQFDAGLPPEA